MQEMLSSVIIYGYKLKRQEKIIWEKQGDILRCFLRK